MAKKITSPELTEEFTKTLAMTKMLDVEVDEELGVLFDKLAPEFGLFAHQYAEHSVRLHRIGDVYADEGALCGIHSRLPKLLLVHFAQTFIALKFKLRPLVLGAEIGERLVVVKIQIVHTLRRNLVEGRLGGVDVTVFDERAHIAEEKC